MTKQRKTSSAKRKQTQKTRSSRTPKRSKATWQDPNVSITKISKGKKTTGVKKNQNENSCWWFGWE